MSSITHFVVQDQEGTRTLTHEEFAQEYVKVNPAASVECVCSQHTNRGLPPVGCKINVYQEGKQLDTGERKDWVTSKNSAYEIYNAQGQKVLCDTKTTEWGYA